MSAGAETSDAPSPKSSRGTRSLGNLEALERLGSLVTTGYDPATNHPEASICF